MDETFELPVSYKGEELLFPAQLKQTGYTHCIVVNVYGQDVLFEPDDERNYRAIIEGEKTEKQITVALLKVIAEAIESIVK